MHIITAIWRRPWARLSLWGRRWQQRRQLAQLDERTLRDSGISRYDVLMELRKPFWRE